MVKKKEKSQEVETSSSGEPEVNDPVSNNDDANADVGAAPAADDDDASETIRSEESASEDSGSEETDSEESDSEESESEKSGPEESDSENESGSKKYVAAPQREWLKKDLYKSVKEIIFDGYLVNNKMINKDNFLNKYQKYSESNELGNSFFIWKVLNLEILFNQTWKKIK